MKSKIIPYLLGIAIVLLLANIFLLTIFKPDYYTHHREWDHNYSPIFGTQSQGGPHPFTQPIPNELVMKAHNQYINHPNALKTTYTDFGIQFTNVLKGFRVNLGVLYDYGFLDSTQFKDLFIFFAVRPTTLGKSPSEQLFTLCVANIDHNDSIYNKHIDGKGKKFFALEYSDPCPPKCPKNICNLLR